jgi:surface protein
LNGWDVSKVTIMCDSTDGSPYGMFERASSFNQDLDAWDVSRVTNMGSMFAYASSFNQSLNAWNISRVTNMQYMFYDASIFNQDLCPWGNISSFPYDTVDDMFSNSGCTIKDSPKKTRRGPFCASDCIVSVSSSVSQLYSKLSLIEHIANENHQLSAKVAAGKKKQNKKPEQSLCDCPATRSNVCPKPGQKTYKC